MSKDTPSNTNRGLHVAILPDGNGRWAAARGLARSEGHRAGVAVVRRVVAAAPKLGIGTLTVYAFSSNNWERPLSEVKTLLAVLEDYLRNEAAELAAHGVRLRVLGRRDRLPISIVEAIELAERTTANANNNSRGLELRIAIDYSARESILQAACWMLSSVEISDREFARRLGQVTHGDRPAPDVDLLIRTGGERRMSDFLLWECAYAELLFIPAMWPEFTAADLEAAIEDFLGRERRFGRLPETAAAS
jgi:undecaprenyl diphosphate synthase